MSNAKEKVPELQDHEHGDHRHEAPHPGHSDEETLRKRKADIAHADNREHTHKLPPKRGDSSDRAFGT